MPAAYPVPPLSVLLCDASVLESIPASICVLDPEGRVIASSARLLEYAGVGLAEIQAWDTGSPIVHPDDLPGVISTWTTAFNAGERYSREFRMRRADGVYRWQLAEAAPLRDSDGTITHWILALVDIHERKTAERAVSRTQELLQLVTELLPANVAYIDRDELYVFANENYRAFYGVDPESLRGRTIRDFIGPRAYAEVEPAIRKALAGEPAEIEVHTTVPGGQRRTLHAKNVPDIGTDGEVRGFVSLVMDVTEQRREAELQEHTAELTRLVTDRVPALIGLVDQDERYRFVNATFGEWFDVDPEAVVGTGIREGLDPAVYEEITPYLRRALGGELAEFDVELPRPEGGSRLVHAVYLPETAPDGSPRGFVVLAQDISAERKAQALADENQERLQLLADVGAALNRSADTASMAREVAQLLCSTLADMVTVDTVEDGRVSRIAADAADRVKASDKDALLWTPLRLGSQGEGVMAAIRTGQAQYWRQMPADLSAFARSPAHLRALEEARAESGAWAPIISGGDVTGVLGVMRMQGSRPFDRSDFELVRELARRIGAGFERAALITRLQEALEAKDSFIGFVSHELKTPLTALLGFSDVLARRIDQIDPDTTREVALLLVNEARRLDEIIENLLMLARGERGAEDEPVLIRRIVPSVVRNHRWRYGAREVKFDAGGEIGPVLAPQGWIEQVVENLLSNAEKYSPPGTPIEVDVHTEPGWVIVHVLDRGRGISEEDAREVFEPFFRASPRAGAAGIGLGLTVCRKLTERLGGEIWLRPREGGGTEAGFRVPSMGINEE
ncbi:MAG TPA: PAS domain-containing protein [Tepidiformaceae bacterium]|nr:PAS domain-containing protein [Tepidiformaceae bacterium]